MARYRDAKCRLCRREGQKLFLKGARCFTDKCAIERRNYPPGQHGLNRGKLTPFGVQLREKQKAKRIYGVLESQFRKYFQWAESQKGVTGENLLRLLELRLDNVVHRLGFAASRRESRQMVAHGHFQVNGRKVSVPSYIVSVGDVVQLRPTPKKVEWEILSEQYGRLVAEPFEKGYALTVGHSLRRTLLSIVSGAADAWIK